MATIRVHAITLLLLSASILAPSCGQSWDDDDAAGDDDTSTSDPCGNPAWECETPGTTEVRGSGACNDSRECLGDCTWGECATTAAKTRPAAATAAWI